MPKHQVPVNVLEEAGQVEKRSLRQRLVECLNLLLRGELPASRIREKAQMDDIAPIETAFSIALSGDLSPHNFLDLLNTDDVANRKAGLRTSTGTGWSTTWFTQQEAWWHAFGNNTGTPFWGFDGGNLKVSSDGSTFRTVGLVKAARSTTVDLGSIAAGGTSVLSMAAPGVAIGDPVFAGSTNNPAGLILVAYVGVPNQVSVGWYNATGAAIDPASTTFTVRVFA